MWVVNVGGQAKPLPRHVGPISSGTPTALVPPDHLISGRIPIKSRYWAMFQARLILPICTCILLLNDPRNIKTGPPQLQTNQKGTGTAVTGAG